MDLKLLKIIIKLQKKLMQLEGADIGFDCNRIAIEKLKHFVSKDALKY